MSREYTGEFGGIRLNFRFKYDETEKYFNGWLKEINGDCDHCIEVTQQDYDDQKEKWNIDEGPYTESLLSVYRACDELLKYNRCVFHGAAYLWRGKAFLFTAKSGTGKSTQLFNWLELYGDEIKVMNGDKPVLCAEENRIMVYPSPWKGKEGMGDDTLSAPLGGIIILEQGKENYIKKLRPNESVPQLLQRILFTAENRELVLNAGKFIEEMIIKIPVYKLVNTGNKESSILTYETIGKETE